MTDPTDYLKRLGIGKKTEGETGRFVTCHSDVQREAKFAKTLFSSFNSQEYQIGFTLQGPP